MYHVLPTLVNPERCASIVSAAKHALPRFKKSQGVMRRMGIHGNEVMSEYAVLKYWRMSKSLKALVDDTLPSDVRDQINEVWLLHFPIGGQLDCYQSKKALFNCLSVPLNDGGTFNIWEQGKPVSLTNKAGNGITFSLANPHSVSITKQADWYLCCLFLNHVSLDEEVNSHA